QHVKPVETDELRVAIAETYDVIVQPPDARAYTLFAEAMDRSGYARGTLAPREGMQGEVPERRLRPLLTMADMGMDHDRHDLGTDPGQEGHQMPRPGHEGHDMPPTPAPERRGGGEPDMPGAPGMPGHEGHDMGAMGAMQGTVLRP